MDKVKELVKDPAVLEAKIKEFWSKIDVNGEGSVALADFKTRSEKLAKSEGLEAVISNNPEDKEKGKKILDPNGTGKVNFEGFNNFLKAGIEKFKREGKL